MLGMTVDNRITWVQQTLELEKKKVFLKNLIYLKVLGFYRGVFKRFLLQSNCTLCEIRPSIMGIVHQF